MFDEYITESMQEWYFKPVFPNPGPQVPLPCMFPCSHTPDSNDQLVIRLLQRLDNFYFKLKLKQFLKRDQSCSHESSGASCSMVLYCIIVAVCIFSLFAFCTYSVLYNYNIDLAILVASQLSIVET